LKISSPNDENNENDSDNPRQNYNDTRPIQFQWKRVRLYDQFLTAYLYESCLEAGEAVVTNVSGRPKNKWRPVPLATVDLQKRASRFLRIGSETLMTAAEELYHQGYISYPRTETEKFRPEFNHRTLIQQFTALENSEFGAYANHLLSDNNFQNPRAGQHDDQAHPPITPCKAVDPEQIGDPTQRSVYKLVVKHYLACCSRDAIGRETQLTVRMSSEEFTATGLMVLEKNWLEIYHPWEEWGTGQGELPHVEIGSRVTPFSLLFKEGCTTPPQPISEVELITLMDRNGIGTDATIAQHITTIQDREYVTKDASMRFHPTKLGIALVEAYNSIGYQLNKPDLRRETEAECNLVASGQKMKAEIIVPLLEKMKRCYETTTQEADKLDQAIARHYSRLGANDETMQVIQGRFSQCGICQSFMSLKQDRVGRGANGPSRKLLFCDTCRLGYNIPRGRPIPKTMQQNVASPFHCPICHFQVIDISRGDGYDGNGYSVCPSCFSHPPREHGGSVGGSDFRCFSCQHPACTLASGTPGGDIEVFRCPFCNNNNSVCVKKNSKGYVLSCNKYVTGQDRCPYTIWLPKACLTVSVCTGDENNIDNICVRCSAGGGVVKKIKMVWRSGSVPPHLGPHCTACLLCDIDLRRELEINLPQQNQVVFRGNHPVRGGGRGRSAGRADQRQESTRAIVGHRREQSGRGTTQNHMHAGRGSAQPPTSNVLTCFKCGQPGHFANNCPSR
jgi:DNA topoisomerase III